MGPGQARQQRVQYGPPRDTEASAGGKKVPDVKRDPRYAELQHPGTPTRFITRVVEASSVPPVRVHSEGDTQSTVPNP